MKNQHFIGLIILLIMSISSCVTESTDPKGLHEIRPLTYEEEILLNSSNEFSFELLRMLGKSEPDKNVLFSSLGIGNGIGMSLNILEIKPKEELKNFLKISEVRDIEINKAYFELGRMLNYLDLDVRFENGNSLWINHTEEFNMHSSDKIMAYYDADVNYMNFTSPKNIKRINQWAENRTFGKIHTVIDTVIASDKSYIINLLYFDISKAMPFEQINPKKLIFNTLKGDRVDCNGLSLHNGTYKIYQSESFDLIDIPLGKGQFHLSLIIPSKYKDINKLVEKLNPAIVNTYLDMTTETTDDLLLPDFKINSEIRLKGLFPEFGLTGPLEVIKGYYFTQNLFISDFIHKTHFAISDISEVNSADFETISTNSEYIVDKPFLLIIREKFTGAMVFTGKMIVPIDDASE